MREARSYQETLQGSNDNTGYGHFLGIAKKSEHLLLQTMPSEDDPIASGPNGLYG
jgi:hypothetical protein